MLCCIRTNYLPLLPLELRDPLDDLEPDELDLLDELELLDEPLELLDPE
jgi:hypothetical protein